ncbi:MAG: type II toxin-antitoxin system VapC family toxin [Chloroflexi bacterium]|nr:type II toxin-antitoxin system VapC family toxin [Chloroflexota bacterium]
MILYLDTSSLVKLYVREKGSDHVKTLVDRAEVVATSQVAYPEACAAFSRKQRQGDFTGRQYRSVVKNLQQDWGSYFALDVSWTVARLAGELAEQHELRGFDAIHLASALMLMSRLLSALTFSSADQKLEEAAAAEKLVVAL